MSGRVRRIATPEINLAGPTKIQNTESTKAKVKTKVKRILKENGISARDIYTPPSNMEGVIIFLDKGERVRTSQILSLLKANGAHKTALQNEVVLDNIVVRIDTVKDGFQHSQS